ncbi:O-sialoglycoprotein endopeptidase [Effusibacillus consociatus]|uniref:N(6)-L-threonylcarbamoyladenine synthase n=1 Tax=Effusibacillus consociatus TaxID=1117041 RepID=A0ABV9Q528_9BACL
MILGIDTSNYTTSICLIDQAGQIVHEQRKLLSVEEGERGLQQSAALFQHIKNLPDLVEKIGDLRGLQAVCVSSRPRPSEGSYMPVFLAGEGLARSLAAAFNIPLYRTSHQEGHIAAGEGTSGPVPADEFLAIHLSGGTSDLLHVKRYATGYAIEILGSSQDLHAGQFVDRVGVALGLPFPAGPHLEKLALTAEGDESSIRLPSPVSGFNWSLSGPETAARRYMESGGNPAAIARAVENCIAKGLEKVLGKAIEETNLRQILIVGGVAANQHIRKRLQHRLEHPAVKAQLYFADPRYSTDNAFGVARIGLLTHNYHTIN